MHFVLRAKTDDAPVPDSRVAGVYVKINVGLALGYGTEVRDQHVV